LVPRERGKKGRGKKGGEKKSKSPGFGMGGTEGLGEMKKILGKVGKSKKKNPRSSVKSPHLRKEMENPLERKKKKGSTSRPKKKIFHLGVQKKSLSMEEKTEKKRRVIKSNEKEKTWQEEPKWTRSGASVWGGVGKKKKKNKVRGTKADHCRRV